tara:strand:- start:3548 stop:4528 length:981 start_codon:yes stop_codon:yes gene_type:complete
MIDYKNKYLKYKQKYLNFKKQKGGSLGQITFELNPSDFYNHKIIRSDNIFRHSTNINKIKNFNNKIIKQICINIDKHIKNNELIIQQYTQNLYDTDYIEESKEQIDGIIDVSCNDLGLIIRPTLTYNNQDFTDEINETQQEEFDRLITDIHEQLYYDIFIDKLCDINFNDYYDDFESNNYYLIRSDLLIKLIPEKVDVYNEQIINDIIKNINKKVSDTNITMEEIGKFKGVYVPDIYADSYYIEEYNIDDFKAQIIMEINNICEYSNTSNIDIIPELTYDGHVFDDQINEDQDNKIDELSDHIGDNITYIYREYIDNHMDELCSKK